MVYHNPFYVSPRDANMMRLEALTYPGIPCIIEDIELGDSLLYIHKNNTIQDLIEDVEALYGN